jgi:hypothetical protein
VSLLQQAADLAILGYTARAPLNEPPCPHCRPEKGCFLHPWHPMNLIRARRMPRDAYREYRHILRERSYQAREQERDIESFRDTNGYRMPYSIAHAMGYDND